MSDSSESWINDLVEEIRDTEKLVKELNERKPAAVSELKATIQRDVERLDNELYGGEKKLEVVQFQNDDSDFAIVSRAGRNFVRMGVWLLPREYALIYELYIKNTDDSQQTNRQTFSLKIVAGDYGEITYLDSYPREVTLDEISKRLIEPVVKAGSDLNFDQP